MDKQDLQEEFEINFTKPRFNINPIVLFVFFGGLFLLTIGLGMAFFKSQQSGKVEIISSGAVQGANTPSEVVVHVDGAVIRPGVYKLSSDLRVDDAIKAAGGTAEGAKISGLNLAAKLTDGQKIYVPATSEQVLGDKGKVVSQSQNSFVSVNSGSQAELESLPGVGPATARKIISGRPYGTLEELVSKKAISSSTYEKIKDQIGL